MNRVIFFITADVHILDLAGAMQAFYEAGYHGRPYEMRCVSDEPVKECSTKVMLAELGNFWEVEPVEGDILIIPGFEIGELGAPADRRVRDWLCGADRRGVTICSI